MDPRIRQRRAEVRRAAGRRRLKILVASAVAATLGIGAYGSTRSPLLDVDTVKVRGTHETAPQEVVAAAGLDRRRQLIDLDGSVLARRVEDLPWVARATVRRDWPGTVEISIEERKVLAVVVAPSGEHFAYVDRAGRVLGPAPGAGDRAVIAGLAEVPAPGAVVEGAETALAALERLGGEPGVAEARIGDGGLELVLTDGPRVHLGDAAELAEKVLALRTLADRVDLSQVATIDVRVPSAPALTRR